MKQEYCLMTKENIPQSVKISLIIQLILIGVAILFEFTLFFTNVYEIYSPQFCTISFTGKQKCLNQDGNYITNRYNCNDCQFLTLLWPFSLAELVLLLFIFSCKLFYYFTLSYLTLVKIVTVVTICVIISCEIFLLTKYNDNMSQISSFNYGINLYPIIAKIMIAILIICATITMWIEDVQTQKFKNKKILQSTSSSQQQQLLQIQ